MHQSVSSKILEDPKLYSHLKEHSYWIKYLNRDPNTLKDFAKKMKEVYKERPTDKINTVIDNVELLSTLIDSMK